MKLPGADLPKLQSSDRIEQIVRFLHEYIIDGNIKPGTELAPERELAGLLGVSRFSLREALRAAQAQGLIEIRQGRRPRVTAPSGVAAAAVVGITLRRTKNSLLQLVAARELLESHIASLAASAISSADIMRMETTVSEMEKNPDDLAFCAEKDIEFHDILLKASGNVVFEIMLSPVAELLRESREHTFGLRGTTRAIEGHTSILASLKARDCEGAALAMRKHLEMAEEDLSQIES